jgi:hypothetical protein
MVVGGGVFAVAVDAASNIIITTAGDSQNVLRKHLKVFSLEGVLLYDRLGGLEMQSAAAGGLAIDPSSGRIAVGEGSVLLQSEADELEARTESHVEVRRQSVFVVIIQPTYVPRC